MAELPLGERGGEQLLGHDKSRVVRSAARFQSSHVDECIERKDSYIDEGRLHVLPDQRDGDRNRRSETSGAVYPSGLEDLGGYALDGADQTPHRESAQDPQYRD